MTIFALESFPICVYIIIWLAITACTSQCGSLHNAFKSFPNQVNFEMLVLCLHHLLANQIAIQQRGTMNNIILINQYRWSFDRSYGFWNFLANVKHVDKQL